MSPIGHGHIRKRDDRCTATTAGGVAIKTVNPLRPDMIVGADSTAITQTRFTTEEGGRSKPRKRVTTGKSPRFANLQDFSASIPQYNPLHHTLCGRAQFLVEINNILLLLLYQTPVVTASLLQTLRRSSSYPESWLFIDS